MSASVVGLPMSRQFICKVRSKFCFLNPHLFIFYSVLARKNTALKSLLMKQLSDATQSSPSGLNGTITKSPNENKESSLNKDPKDSFSHPPAAALTYHQMDDVLLSDAGMAMIKSIMIEPPKKTRAKRIKTSATSDPQDPLIKTEEGVSLEENAVDEEERKLKHRRNRQEKCGVGGFVVKQRGGNVRKEDEVVEPVEPSAEPAASVPEGVTDKPKRRRRTAKKRSQLLDSFPVYMQEAFFGKELMESSASRQPGPDVDNDLDQTPSLANKDSVISLSHEVMKDEQITQDQEDMDDDDNMNFLDVGPLDDDDLQQAVDVNFGSDFPPLSPNEMLDMLINDENLGQGDDVDGVALGNSLTDKVAVPDDVANMGMLETAGFDFGFAHMDSKEVEDLLNEMTDSSSMPSTTDGVASNPDVSMGFQQFPGAMEEKPRLSAFPPSSVPPQMMNQMYIPGPQQRMPFNHPQHLPHHQHQQMMPNQMQMSPHPSNMQMPVTPMNSLQQQFGNLNTGSLTQPIPIDPSWQLPEPELENTTQNQKNLVKWEAEEALGDMASISPVLYANINHPNLKVDYPLFAERIKQITKIWRGLSSDQRAPYLAKARDNRSANRGPKSAEKSTAPVSVPKNDQIRMDRPQAPPSQMMPMSSHMQGHSDPYYQHPPRTPNPYMMQQQQQQQEQLRFQQQPMMNRVPMSQAPFQHQHPQCPASAPVAGMPPRFRPQQQTMVRSSSLNSQGSFSPSMMPSDGLQQQYHFHGSPATPQSRPQSTDPASNVHTPQTPSPFASSSGMGSHPPPTPSSNSLVSPFSPSPVCAAGQPGMHGMATHSQIAATKQQPRTPDSFGQMSHPSTPQAPPSPLIAAPSPLSDPHVRSPATPHHGPLRSSQSFDDLPQHSPAIQTGIHYPPSASPAGSVGGGSFSPAAAQSPFSAGQPFSQEASGYVHSPGSAAGSVHSPKVPVQSMRPNIPGTANMMNVRGMPMQQQQHLMMRRAMLPSDPYARQPLTPMPGTAAAVQEQMLSPMLNAATPPPQSPAQSGDDQYSKQQLRNLLQTQQQQRAVDPNRPGSVAPPASVRPNWPNGKFLSVKAILVILFC